MRNGGSRREAVLRLADEPAAAAQARTLAAHLACHEPERVDDARLLLSELVAAALYEGVEFVEVRVAVRRDCLRIEVTAPDRRVARHPHARLTPAAELARHLIEDLSDRRGDVGDTAWCELDGRWKLDTADLDVTLRAAPSAGGVLTPVTVKA